VDKKLSDEPSEVLTNKMHAMVADIARQVKWQINGNLTTMTADDWRHFFVAHVRPSQRIVPNIDGNGIVILGASSKTLKKDEKCLMIELMYAFGSTRGVVWRDPKEAAFMAHYAEN